MEVMPNPVEAAKEANLGNSSWDIKTVRLALKHSLPLERVAKGVSVILVRGTIGSKDNQTLDLQLDSGTDVSLISEEVYSSLRNPPHLRQGLKLKLYQLTDANTNLKGYVGIPVFMTTLKREVLEIMLEAYVVSRMTVPILLGEDY